MSTCAYDKLKKKWVNNKTERKREREKSLHTPQCITKSVKRKFKDVKFELRRDEPVEVSKAMTKVNGRWNKRSQGL